MAQIIEMRSLVGPQLFTFDRSVDGPFCFYAPVDGDRSNTVFPLIDRRRANAEDISSSIPAAENFDDATESLVRNHVRKSKALLGKPQALLIGSIVGNSGAMQKKKAPEETLALGRKIEKAMTEAGLFDAELARMANVSPQAVYEWRKTGRVHKRHLSLIAQVTRKPLSHFLGEKASGLNQREDQLLEIFRDLPDEFQDKLVMHATAQWELAHPGKKSRFSPFAGIAKRLTSKSHS